MKDLILNTLGPCSPFTFNQNQMRTLPYDVNIEDLLNELLEYMEDRADADHDGDNFVPNKEMKFQIEIEQALHQINTPKK